MISIYPMTFENKPYFIYWLAESEHLGITDGGSVLYQEKLNRNRRTEFLKQEIDDELWEKIIEKELNLKQLSDTHVTISRGTRSIELKAEKDFGKVLMRVMGKLVNVYNKTKISASPNKEDIPKPKASPIKKTNFAIPLKKRILEYRDEIID
ncbi:unnamed protein product [Auanema sp. JU1783]|nr:unnamed protein product [Auanema sp. JU1783]